MKKFVNVFVVVAMVAIGMTGAYSIVAGELFADSLFGSLLNALLFVAGLGSLFLGAVLIAVFADAIEI